MLRSLRRSMVVPSSALDDDFTQDKTDIGNSCRPLTESSNAEQDALPEALPEDVVAHVEGGCEHQDGHVQEEQLADLVIRNGQQLLLDVVLGHHSSGEVAEKGHHADDGHVHRALHGAAMGCRNVVNRR